MADSFTDNFSLTLPEIGGSLDTWGNKLNANFNTLDGVLRRLAPVGLIGLWSGATIDIPTGWALCDGSNGTPDLRDRFVVGAGGAYAVGDTGGAASVTLTTAQMPAHSHTGSTGSAGDHSHSGSTGSAGSHSHSGSTGGAGGHSHSIIGRSSGAGSGSEANHWANSGSSNSISTSSVSNHSHSVTINSAGSHTHSVSIGTGGAHTHSVTIGDTGGGESHENRPPYYALAYIMCLPE